LVGRLRLHLNAPGHLINRLDRETSGLIVAARDAPTSAALRKVWQGGSVQKTYLAISHGHPAADAGAIDAPLGRDEACEVTIKDCVRSDGATALTTYRVIQRFTRPEGSFALLEVSPRTGRKHQIRIHLQHLGHPIVGDKLYGGDPSLYLNFVYDRLTPAQRAHLLLPFQALHASRLELPWRGHPWTFHAPPEAWFLDFLPEPVRELVPTHYGGLPAGGRAALNVGDFPTRAVSAISQGQ
jgi:23S rRNA pseudouridine1911/1915/1917 synthase